MTALLAPVQAPQATSLQSDRLHKLHWQQYLVSAGRTFGKHAEYAQDGLLVRTTKGQDVLVLYNPDRRGLGGTIALSVQGLDAAERVQTLRQEVEAFLPGSSRAPCYGSDLGLE
jgi:hypothetical protein